MANFSIKIKKFAEIVKLRHEVVMRKIAFDVLREVIEVSPVDTGRFKASWRIGIMTPDLSVAVDRKSFVDDAEQAFTAATSVLASYRNQSIIWVSNNLHYAVPLELGSSSQAPTGVLGPVVARYNNMIASAVNSAKREVPDA